MINQVYKKRLMTPTKQYLILVELLKKQIIKLQLLRWKVITSITTLATTGDLNAVKNKKPKFSKLVKKQIRIQKYQTLRLNILLHLIVIN